LPCFTPQEKEEYEKLYRDTVDWMKKNGIPVLEEGNPYPKATYEKVELTPKLQEFMARSGCVGQFSGNLPEKMALSKGMIWWPLSLKVLNVDREYWGEGEVTIGYFGAIGLYPNVRTTSEGEVEAFMTVQDWTEHPTNPMILVQYRALGAGRYRFCFDGKPICEVTYGKGITPRATAKFSNDFQLKDLRLSYGLGLVHVGLISVLSAFLGFLAGRR